LAYLRAPEAPPSSDELKMISLIAEKRMKEHGFQSEEMRIRLKKELVRIKAQLLKIALMDPKKLNTPPSRSKSLSFSSISKPQPSPKTSPPHFHFFGGDNNSVGSGGSSSPSSSPSSSSSPYLAKLAAHGSQSNRMGVPSFSILSSVNSLILSRNEDHLLAEARYYFDLYDVGNGSIDVEDVLPILRSLCIPTWSSKKVKRYIRHLDENRDGNITRESFMTWFEDEVRFNTHTHNKTTKDN
jgi:Ca2+-binding EF-hand superfamily protein